MTLNENKIIWKTEKRKLKDLKFFEGNPRQTNEKQKQDLEKSLEKFNLADPLIINTDGTVIGGNFRLKILKEKFDGETEIDVRVPNRTLTSIWKKDRIVLTPAKYQRQYESCFYGWRKKSFFRGDRKQSEVWEVTRPTRADKHPTMKPVELCERAIKNSSKRGDIVLDLFGGSGSTLIACEKLNRRCFMMEIEPIYCQVIIDRWEQFTGQKVKKL